MRPVVLIGANGQLGSDVVRKFESSGHPFIALKRTDLELRNQKQVAEVLTAADPAVVINTAAFHKLEACEADIEQAFAVNCFAVRNLAQIADRLGALLVQISTDYVFDGQSTVPYWEGAKTNPVNVYGASKLAGEFFVRNYCERHLLVRTSGLYGIAGSSGKGGNFVQTMLRLGRERGSVSVVTDQRLSPTYTLDLARVIRLLVDERAEGVFHVTNSGSCSWYEFALAIFELSGLQVETTPVVTSSMGAKIRRPPYSVLDNAELRARGFNELRPWREALASYLDARSQTIVAESSRGPIGVGNAAN